MCKEQKENKPAKVSSKDVARLANVSQSTVSRVFNKSWTGKVNEASRQRVLQAAKALNYTPNAIGSILNTGESKIIGIVLSKKYDIFYAEVEHFLINELRDRDYYAMVFTTDVKEDINSLIDEMKRYKLDGVIITSSALTHQINPNIHKDSLPAVLYNGYVPNLNMNVAHSDNLDAGIMVANYLYGLGHKKFAYVSTEMSRYNSLLIRQEAFIHGLSMNGIDECIIEPAGYTYESGYEAGKRLFSMENYPDAVHCAADSPALGLIDAAQDLGLKVGVDVSITGFYAPLGVDLPRYSLTCLKQDIKGLAKDAVDLLLRQIDNPDATPKRKIRKMELMIGNSTRKNKK